MERTLLNDFEDSFSEFQPENSKIKFALEELQKMILEKKNLEQELLNAKTNYFNPLGRLKETTPSYIHKINAFLNWFIFDYTTTHHQKTPYELFCENLETQNKEIERTFFQQLFPNQHSLFELIKIGDEFVKLKNLSTKTKISVSQKGNLYGLNKGDIFETRVFNIGGLFYFSNYLILHPIKIKKQILNKFKHFFKQKNKDELIKQFLYDLQIYHYKWESYQHIDLFSIYKIN